MIKSKKGNNMSNENEKQAVANEAVKLVRPGMVVGLGSGSTAIFFINALKKRVKNEGLNITCIATSLLSKELVSDHIPLIDEEIRQKIDITFDGADRADLKTFELIKGGGGALLREKLVAASSKQNIVLIDSTKLSSPLEGFPVPVEIVRFGHEATIERINQLGYQGHLRRKNNEINLSDNDNYIFDITFPGPIKNPSSHHTLLKSTLGVIETGFFLNTATKIYIAYPDGTIKIAEKS